jgi:hypothetical protein
MSRRIKVVLTEAQARELLLVAGNGYSDGDFYGLNDELPARGGARQANVYWRAVWAVQRELGKVAARRERLEGR